MIRPPLNERMIVEAQMGGTRMRMLKRHVTRNIVAGAVLNCAPYRRCQTPQVQTPVAALATPTGPPPLISGYAPDRVLPGNSINIVGSDWQAGEEVTLGLFSTVPTTGTGSHHSCCRASRWSRSFSIDDDRAHASFLACGRCAHRLAPQALCHGHAHCARCPLLRLRLHQRAGAGDLYADSDAHRAHAATTTPSAADCHACRRPSRRLPSCCRRSPIGAASITRIQTWLVRPSSFATMQSLTLTGATAR